MKRNISLVKRDTLLPFYGPCELGNSISRNKKYAEHPSEEGLRGRFQIDIKSDGRSLRNGD